MKNTAKISFASVAALAAMVAGCGGNPSANLDHRAPVVPAFHYADELGRPLGDSSKDEARVELILASLEKARIRKRARAGEAAIDEAAADAARAGEAAINEAAANAAHAGEAAINEAAANAAHAGEAAINEAAADAARAGEAAINEAAADAAHAGAAPEAAVAESLRARMVARAVEPVAPSALRARAVGNAEVQARDALRASVAGASEPAAEAAQAARVTLRHPDGQAITWGELRQAWGRVQVSCEPTGTRLAVSLSRLIPGGTYSGELRFFRAPGFARAGLDALADKVSLAAKLRTDENGAARLEAFLPADGSSSCLLEAEEVHLTVSYLQGSYRAPHLSWMIENGWATARSPWTARAGGAVRRTESLLD